MQPFLEVAMPPPPEADYGRGSPRLPEAVVTSHLRHHLNVFLPLYPDPQDGVRCAVSR